MAKSTFTEKVITEIKDAGGVFLGRSRNSHLKFRLNGKLLTIPSHIDDKKVVDEIRIRAGFKQRPFKHIVAWEGPS